MLPSLHAHRHSTANDESAKCVIYYVELFNHVELARALHSHNRYHDETAKMILIVVWGLRIGPHAVFLSPELCNKRDKFYE